MWKAGKLWLTRFTEDVYAHCMCHVQILCSEVDFWGRQYALEDMKLMHEEKMYPPKVTLMVYNKSPEPRTAPVNVKIWGARKKKAIATIVKFFSAGI